MAVVGIILAIIPIIMLWEIKSSLDEIVKILRSWQK